MLKYIIKSVKIQPSFDRGEGQGILTHHLLVINNQNFLKRPLRCEYTIHLFCRIVFVVFITENNSNNSKY